MLRATRDDAPHAHAVHYGLPPRTVAARFTTGIQLVGSLVGIPLALIGGYSTYHATFSPEGRCQALRANIVSMLDKKTDASTLRLLVQKDVVTFERECGQVDADAAAAFKILLGAEKTPAVAHRVAPSAKVEKVEAVAAQPPAKVEKAEKIEKHEPVKREVVKRDVPAKEAPAKEAVAKLESPKQLGAPPQPLAIPSSAAEQVTPPPQAETIVEQAKPIETAAVQPQTANVDATWVASVREALRESASQPSAAETTSDVAAPIDISPEPQQLENDASAGRRNAFVPPADVGPAPRMSAPRPPAPIPNAN